MANSHSVFAGMALDRASVIPAFQQIVQQLNCIINIRQLSAGEALPRIRSLAVQLGVNPNTVAKAYAELESAGVIVKKRGSGCVVAMGANAGAKRSSEAALQSRIDELVTWAGTLGVTPDELASRIQDRLPRARTLESGRIPAKRKARSSRSPSDPAATAPESIWQPGDEFVD